MAGGSAEKQPVTASPTWASRAAGWMRKQAERPRARRLRAFYTRHKRFAPPMFFFGGVLWDALTLKRIDAWFDNVFLLVYLVVAGGLVLAVLRLENGDRALPRLAPYRDWLPSAIQFFLGALFSAYVIFYFQSASLTQHSVFLGLLIVLLVGNEFLHERLVNLYLLLALYFLATSAFFIFFIPVVTKTMSYATFLAGGLVGLAVVSGMAVYLKHRSVLSRVREVAYVVGLAAFLLGGLNLFYLQHWIPPVPLAMRYGVVAHHAARVGDAYDLRVEPSPWYAFWTQADRRFHRVEGETVYCFAAVFAPTRLKQTIYHEWSVYDEDRQAWVQTDRIGYQVVGGRFNGYRGYTFKRRVHPGRWRVDVATENGHTIGRIRFTVVRAATPVTDLRQVLYP